MSFGTQHDGKLRIGQLHTSHIAAKLQAAWFLVETLHDEGITDACLRTNAAIGKSIIEGWLSPNYGLRVYIT